MKYGTGDTDSAESIEASLGPPLAVLGTTEHIQNPHYRVIVYDFASKTQEMLVFNLIIAQACSQ